MRDFYVEKYMISGIPFENSRYCEGRSYVVPDAPTDLAIINISGPYPEGGNTARKRECHEMVHVVSGFGSLAIRGAAMEELHAGDVVHVPPGTEFSWDGHMQIAMACTPPFDPEQYEVLNWSGLKRLTEEYFPEDVEFVCEQDFDDALGSVYGMLVEYGEDPETVLQQYGVIEDDGNGDE